MYNYPSSYYGNYNYNYQYVYPAPTCTITSTTPYSYYGGYYGNNYGSNYGYNQSVTLAWSASNASSAYISGVGTVLTSGSTNITPYGNQVYTLRVTGPGGTNTCQTTVNSSYPYNTNNYYSGYPYNYNSNYYNNNYGYPYNYNSNYYQYSW
jgi:hypothetical protein